MDDVFGAKRSVKPGGSGAMCPREFLYITRDTYSEGKKGGGDQECEDSVFEEMLGAKRLVKPCSYGAIYPSATPIQDGVQGEMTRGGEGG